jgi:multidrug resistance efflux pump
MSLTKFELENETAEVRSEELQEIVGEMPKWIIRWGISVVFIAVLGFLFISWFIKYPDVINARVVITTSPALVTLVSRSSGSLVLLKEENDEVKEGDLIGYISSNTSLSDINELEASLGELSYEPSRPSIRRELKLGEILDSYVQYVHASENLTNFYLLNQAQIEKNQLEQQLQVHYRLKEILVEQSLLSAEESMLLKKRYSMDSTLFANSYVPLSEHINSKVSYLQNLRSQKNAEIAEANENIEIQNYKNKLSTLKLQQLEEESNLRLDYANALRVLKMKISQWKSTYLVTSPCEGKVAYLGFLENKMFIESGKQLFSILPEKGHIYAQVELPVAGSGKIKEGQTVNINLDNYPAEQFGMLYGTVKEISLLPNADKYLAKIELNNSLTTSYNKQLTFKQHLQGNTEIITEDLRLLERIFYQFKKLIL